jgi:O-antigen ligase
MFQSKKDMAYNSRDLFVLGLFSAVIAVPPFFSGGLDEAAKAFLLISILPLSFFVWKIKGGFAAGGARLPFAFLAVFLLGAGISIFYSPEKYSAVEMFSVLLASGLLGFLVFNFIGSRREIRCFGYLIVGLGIILSLIGIHYFILSQNFGYLRLVSTFYHHIPFGEFLAYPFFLALGWLFLGNPGRKLKIGLALANSLFATAFFFNHCRGAWLSFAVVLAIFIFLFRKRIFNRQSLVTAVIVFSISIVSIAGLCQLKSYQARQVATAVAGSGSSAATAAAVKYDGQETLQENAATARFLFWRRAWDIFKDRPLIGGGLASFPDFHKQYLQPPFYYSIDPHNFYLKLLAENGIFIFLAFAGFALSFIYRGAKSFGRIRDAILSEKDAAAIFSSAMLAGALCGILNNGVNFGWSYPANLAIFFFCCGVVLKSASLYGGEGADKNKGKIFSRAGLAVFVLASGLFLLGILIFMSNASFRQGQYSFEDKDYFLARDDFGKAAQINPADPEFNVRLAELDLALARGNSGDPQAYVSDALAAIESARHWSDNSDNSVLEGRIFLAQGDRAAAEKSLARATEKYPFGIYGHLELAKLYLDENKLAEVHSLLGRLLSKYKKEYILSPIYANPDKPGLLADVASLYRLDGDAYKKENNTKAAQGRYDQADQWSPQN